MLVLGILHESLYETSRKECVGLPLWKLDMGGYGCYTAGCLTEGSHSQPLMRTKFSVDRKGDQNS
jgi:hypothetical protein